MSYERTCCNETPGLGGFWDDLLNSATQVATTAIRSNSGAPVYSGTPGTPYGPVYGPPAAAMNLAPSAFGAMLPYLIGAGVLVYFLTRKR